MRRFLTRPGPPHARVGAGSPHRIRPVSRLATTTVLALLLLAAPGSPGSPPGTSDPVRVVVETDLGTFELEVDTARAPVTATNFLRYVDGGHYDGGSFHRTVHEDNQPNDSIRIAVIQGSRNREAAEASFPRIALERTSATKITHRDGTISMARGRPRLGHAQLLHLHRRPAVTRLRREAQRGRAGVRGLRQGGGWDGCGAGDPPGTL